MSEGSGTRIPLLTSTTLSADCSAGRLTPVNSCQGYRRITTARVCSRKRRAAAHWVAGGEIAGNSNGMTTGEVSTQRALWPHKGTTTSLCST